MKRQMRNKVITILTIFFIIIATAVFVIYNDRYGLTPEDASKTYLKSITSSYKIIDIKTVKFVNNTAQCVVTSNDKFNWLNKDNGRADGENMHFFELNKFSKGWYVTADNGGP